MIHPAQNLAEGHRYIVALRHLKDADGNVIRAQPAFAELVSTRGRAVRAAALLPLAHLPGSSSAPGSRRRSLYLAWDFTVASRRSLTETSLFMRDDALPSSATGRPATASSRARRRGS